MGLYVIFIYLYAKVFAVNCGLMTLLCMYIDSTVIGADTCDAVTDEVTKDVPHAVNTSQCDSDSLLADSSYLSDNTDILSPEQLPPHGRVPLCTDGEVGVVRFALVII